MERVNSVYLFKRRDVVSRQEVKELSSLRIVKAEPLRRYGRQPINSSPFNKQPKVAFYCEAVNTRKRGRIGSRETQFLAGAGSSCPLSKALIMPCRDEMREDICSSER